MITFKDFLIELSKGTLNKYIDKSAEERKKLMDTDNTEKVKKRLSGSSLAITKVMRKLKPKT
jgi:hypothetical protein